MYLHIIKIKINIYIFYTSYGTAMDGQSIPFTLNRTEIWVPSTLSPALNYGLDVHGKQNPWEAIRLFSSSSALLGGPVLRFRLWNICSIFSPLLCLPLPSSPTGQVCSLIWAPWTFIRSNSRNTCGSVEGLPGMNSGPGEFRCSLFSTEIPQP